jgi:hypothetical protein
MTIAGVPLWRWCAFALYLALVAGLLYAVVRLVLAFPVPAAVLLFGYVALALAWPHRYYLRVMFTR